MSVQVELRCDKNDKRMFARLLQEAPPTTKVSGDNLIEFACRDCKRAAEARGEEVRVVFHRFDLMGELVETIVVT